MGAKRTPWEKEASLRPFGAKGKKKPHTERLSAHDTDGARGRPRFGSRTASSKGSSKQLRSRVSSQLRDRPAEILNQGEDDIGLVLDVEFFKIIPYDF